MGIALAIFKGGVLAQNEDHTLLPISIFNSVRNAQFCRNKEIIQQPTPDMDRGQIMQKSQIKESEYSIEILPPVIK